LSGTETGFNSVLMLYWYAFYYVNQNWFSNYQYHPLTWLAAEAGN